MSVQEIREVEILKTPLYIRLRLGPLLSFAKISTPPNGVLGNGALPYLYSARFPGRPMALALKVKQMQFIYVPKMEFAILKNESIPICMCTNDSNIQILYLFVSKFACAWD